MFRPLLALLGLALASTPVLAQAPAAPPCATPDSIAIVGNTRLSDATIRSEAGLAAGQPLRVEEIQRAIRDVFATGQFEDIEVFCAVEPATGRATLTLRVEERPVLAGIEVRGTDAISRGDVSDRIELLVGRPVDPAQVARAVQRIDSLYEAKGYYLATVRPETTTVEGGLRLAFVIDEGRRLAISGIRIAGNEALTDEEIVGAMKISPEGFWWWREGEFDEDTYQLDLAERIPELYARHGFADFRVLGDTLIVDRDRGKALVEITVEEGPRYYVGEFEVIGNRRFSSEEIENFYPFTDEGPTLTERVRGLIRRRPVPSNVFNQELWDEATQRIRTAYSNEGYIYASIRPVVDRELGPDSVPVVNLRWEIEERSPAIINRVEIAGNDYTVEACIRDQLLIVPGQVFNQDRLIRSYQNISNMGFFEAPLPTPETRPANEEGDVDVIFRVKEKRTGNINFGASVGEGTGVGGFIGLDQPNLFGQCKRGSLQWQFGRYINDFSLSYTDPTIQGTRTSGTITAYRTRSRFRIADLGVSTRTGGQLQFGFPVPRSPFTRVFLSYGGESVKYGGEGLLGEQADLFGGSDWFRSTLGLTATHDTRIDMPFPTAGGMQTLSANFSGGPLGGTVDYQRYTGEIRAFAPLGQLGGERPGSQPVKFVLGLTGRAGAVFGDPGPFFYTQRFALGGTQFGEQLRGYKEFSITPSGYVDNATGTQARVQSFGDAFFTTTTEVGVRFNQMVYVNAFFDAGNVWDDPRNFDPTRLFRGAGIGASVITPFGPLGLDWAYGFDRVDALGRPDPGWEFHFKLGQLF